MVQRLPKDDEPCYIISVAARMVSLHPQTLRYYERLGLVQPTRSEGNRRLYSPRDIERLRRIARLTDELGVNLAGAEVILNMARKMEKMREEMEEMEEEFQKEIERLRARLQERES
ncbi:MAG TPA: MerR family transcriptional regulator [Chloroflexi bacterium]|nr:MerR family transcriptional regulator [Chloroflexota bacterium]